MNYYRLCDLYDSIKLRIKRASEPRQPSWEEFRQDSKQRWAALETHIEDTPNHGHGECPECIRILKEWPKLSP